jgi:hypothetical protein
MMQVKLLNHSVVLLLLVFLLPILSFAQSELVIPPSDGTTFLNVQIEDDASRPADRVYVLQTGNYFVHGIITNNEWTLRIKAEQGARPVIYMVADPGTGTFPARMFEMAGDLWLKDLIMVGFVEAVPGQIDNNPPRLIRSNTAGWNLTIDGCILTQSRGEHIRLQAASHVVKITDCIFANMGDLGSSNLGAGKPFDFRDTTCDTAIFVNNTFVNFQDRIIRHRVSTGPLNYFLFDHNTAINSMGYHGTLALGVVGDETIITNNLFIDTFIAGADTDRTRQSEFEETGEIDPRNGLGKMFWVLSVPNNTTNWTVKGNYYSVSPEVQAFYDAHAAEGVLGEGPPLTHHINSRLGPDSLMAFIKESITITNRPVSMVNMAEWYRDPNGGNKTKNTPTDLWDRATDDYDRRPWQYFADTLDCTYPTTAAAYTGAQGGFPAGDLNWFPDKKAEWEQWPVGISITVDGDKDPFYETLTGPDDGYLQIKYYAGNNNGSPYNNADLSANMWVAWDETWFYFYEEVMDDTISMSSTNTYNNDGVEIKIDPQPTDSTQTNNTILSLDMTALYTDGAAGQTNIGSIADDSNKQYARKLITGGYALELAVKWSAITAGAPVETITPAVGNVFGAALHNHDNDNPTGRREASVAWAAVLLDQVWNTPKYLGTVKFLADNKLQFIPKNNMTPRTNPVPYDGTPFFVAIDGKKDPVYTALRGPNDGYLQIRSYAYNDNGQPVNDADLSAKVWTAWDDDWFYLYEEVKDDTLSGNATNVYEEDCIELKFDPQATDSVTNSVWDTRLTALGMGTAGVVSADSLNNVADSLKKWARARVTGGYNLEMAIKWSAIGHNSPETNESITPAADNVFGMAICQHDNDGKARRQASIMWGAVMRDAVWNTPKYHGTVKLLADNKLEFIPKNNMTGVTNPIPYDGSDYTGVEYKEAPTLPKVFSLEQNYPNPFNPTTTISYSIPSASEVHLAVYDILGRELMVLVNEKKEAGNYSVTFEGKSYVSGLYFYRLRAGSYVKTQKMMMLK